jgi:hypothetical protein
MRYNQLRAFCRNLTLSTVGPAERQGATPAAAPDLLPQRDVDATESV